MTEAIFIEDRMVLDLARRRQRRARLFPIGNKGLALARQEKIPFATSVTPDPASPYRYYWGMLNKKMRFSNRQIVFKTRPEQDDAELTDDYLVERLVLCGSVNRVVDQLLALREQAGEFGEIVYAGMDWVDPGLARRSMELMATEVMPRVNRALSQSRKGEPACTATR